MSVNGEACPNCETVPCAELPLCPDIFGSRHHAWAEGPCSLTQSHARHNWLKHDSHDPPDVRECPGLPEKASE